MIALRQRRRWVAGVVLLGLAGPPLAAQDVTVRSYLDRTQVGLNQQFTLSVEISGANRVTSDPQLPDMAAFSRFLGTSSSQQIQIVNGRTSVATTLQYRFLATAEGTFAIGAVRLEVGGQSFTTAPLTISIVSAGATPSTPQPGRAVPRGAGPDAAIAPEDLFLRATASKRSVFENEPVIVEYTIYTRVQVSSYSLVKQPGTTGFWVEDFELPASPETRAEVLNGRRYTAATLKRMALFPTGPGARTADPMAIEAEVRVRGLSRDPFDDFFGSSLFGRTVQKIIASEPLSIDVLPLPAADRPADFSGFVGSLDVSASTDKTAAETNEAISYTLEISGSGNLRALPDPVIDFPPDFEVYDPEVTERIDRGANRITGRKTYEYVLIPRAPGRRTVPSVTVSYFDPRTGAYALAESEPVTLEVSGDAVIAPVTAARGRGAIRTLRDDIRFIRTDPPAFRLGGRTLVTRAPFWIVFGLPLLVLAGALSYRRHADRLRGDVAYARQRRASGLAKRRLAKAKSLAHAETHKEFFAETSTALMGFLGDRLNLPEAGLVRDEVRQHLARRAVSDRVAAEVADCLDVCDRMRFAPSAADSADMMQLLRRAALAMSDLDKELSKRQ